MKRDPDDFDVRQSLNLFLAKSSIEFMNSKFWDLYHKNESELQYTGKVKHFNAKIEYNKNNAFSNPLAFECARNNVNSILSFVHAKKKN